MQEAKPTSVRNFQITQVMTEAFQLLPGSKWPILGSWSALMVVTMLIPLVEFLLYAILVKSGGNVRAGMIVMGSAIALAGLYFCSGIAAGIFKISIERSRNNPISLRMSFQYFSRALPLLFTFILSCLFMLPFVILTDTSSAALTYFFSHLIYFIRGYYQIILFALVVTFLTSAVQASKSKISYRAPLIIFIILVLFFFFPLASEYILLLTQITIFILNFMVSTIISAFLYLSLPLAVDKTNSPFKAIFLSLKTIRPHWFKIVLLLMAQYFLILMPIILVLLLGGLSNGYVVVSLGLIIMTISQIWVIPLIFLMQGVTYHKLID